jgi:hypothetical protein
MQYDGRELLAKLSRSEELDLTLANVTDAGIRGLELIPTLEELNFQSLRGNCGRELLAELSRPEELDLTRTNVTMPASAVWSSFPR